MNEIRAWREIPPREAAEQELRRARAREMRSTALSKEEEGRPVLDAQPDRDALPQGDEAPDADGFQLDIGRRELPKAEFERKKRQLKSRVDRAMRDLNGAKREMQRLARKAADAKETDEKRKLERKLGDQKTLVGRLQRKYEEEKAAYASFVRNYEPGKASR